MKSLLYILLLLISPEIFAGVFDPPPTDLSVRLLGIIFGSNIGNVYLGGSANPVMSAIMEKFNFIVVVIGTVIVSYVGIMSTINTAQEGSAMGKKWSAIWIPMRSIAGMALMIPSPASGYSMIQVTVMWIIVQGIGAADQIWNIALTGLKSGASAIVSTTSVREGDVIRDVNEGTDYSGARMAAQKILPEMLNVAVCMEALNKFGKVGPDHNDCPSCPDLLSQKAQYIKHFTESQPEIINTNSVTIKGVTYFGINDPSDPDPSLKAICGQLPVEATAYKSDFSSEPTQAELVKAATLIYDTKQLALSTMLTVLRPLAQTIVDGLTTSNGGIEPTIKQLSDLEIDAGFKYTATNAYASILAGLTAPKTLGKQELLDDVKTGMQKGWVIAGSYYFVFVQKLTSSMYQDYATQADFNIDNSPPSCTDPKCASSETYWTLPSGPSPGNAPGIATKFSLSQTELELYERYLGYGAQYLDFDSAKATDDFVLKTTAPPSNIDPIVDAMLNVLNDVNRDVIAGLQEVTEQVTNLNADPLLAHSILGRRIMLACEAAWIALAMAYIIGSIPLLFSVFGVGLGAFALMGSVLALIGGIILPLIAAFWTMGASLAIYTPLIPYIIFTTAVLGWLLAVVEAIIAAPLIALGLVMPSGDELGKLETALSILANIFLRPMLMIFGFLLAGRVYKAIVTLIDIGMLEIFKTIDVSTLLSPIVIIFAYAAFIIGTTNTCFSLIYIIPDKILRWIGGGHEQSDMSAAQAAKAGTEGAAKQVGSEAGGLAKEVGTAAGKQSGKAREHALSVTKSEAGMVASGISKAGSALKGLVTGKGSKPPGGGT